VEAHANTDISEVWREKSSEDKVGSRYNVSCFDLGNFVFQASPQEAMQATRRRMRQTIGVSNSSFDAVTHATTLLSLKSSSLLEETDSCSIGEISMYPATTGSAMNAHAWYSTVYKRPILQPCGSVVASRDAVSRMLASLEVLLEECISKCVIKREAVVNHVCFEMLR
jgi:hypothetical protein